MVNHNFRVLLVDDEAFAREIIAQRLVTLPGVSVAAECANGIAASEYLRSHKVDMLITDIMMTGMDGLELAEFCHRLEDAGVQIHEIPGSELSRGRGGPRCMSMPLLRRS